MFWKLPALGKIGKIGIVPPEAEPGRDGLAIALIVKNEAAISASGPISTAAPGCARFLIYDNGCTDATLPILRDRARATR